MRTTASPPTDSAGRPDRGGVSGRPGRPREPTRRRRR
nr:MAG TPA: hypothetical protein [Caudoviricetes sp.]